MEAPLVIGGSSGGSTAKIRYTDVLNLSSKRRFRLALDSVMASYSGEAVRLLGFSIGQIQADLTTAVRALIKKYSVV